MKLDFTHEYAMISMSGEDLSSRYEKDRQTCRMLQEAGRLSNRGDALFLIIHVATKIKSIGSIFLFNIQAEFWHFILDSVPQTLQFFGRCHFSNQV